MALDPRLQALARLIQSSPYRGVAMDQQGRLNLPGLEGGVTPEELVSGLASGDINPNLRRQGRGLENYSRGGGRAMSPEDIARFLSQNHALIGSRNYGAPSTWGRGPILPFGRQRTAGHAGLDTGGVSSISNPFYNNPDFDAYLGMLGGWGEGRRRRAHDPTAMTPQQRTQHILAEQARLRAGGAAPPPASSAPPLREGPPNDMFVPRQPYRGPQDSPGLTSRYSPPSRGFSPRFGAPSFQGRPTFGQGMFVPRQPYRGPQGFGGLQAGQSMMRPDSPQDMFVPRQPYRGPQNFGGLQSSYPLREGPPGDMFVPRQPYRGPQNFGGLQAGDDIGAAREGTPPRPVGQGPPKASGGFQFDPSRFRTSQRRPMGTSPFSFSSGFQSPYGGGYGGYMPMRRLAFRGAMRHPYGSMQGPRASLPPWMMFSRY